MGFSARIFENVMPVFCGARDSNNVDGWPFARKVLRLKTELSNKERLHRIWPQKNQELTQVNHNFADKSLCFIIQQVKTDHVKIGFYGPLFLSRLKRYDHSFSRVFKLIEYLCPAKNPLNGFGFE